MTTLITGATGFVGSGVLRQLLKAGHTVRAMLRPRSDRRNIEGLPVEVTIGDLTDRTSLDRAVSGCTALFHVAADYRLWVPNPTEIYDANVTGTRNIMLAAAEAGVERIVYTSSVATLGPTTNGKPADETTPVSIDGMIGHYKRSKFLAEAEVRRLAEETGLPVVIVNPSTPAGPRDIKPTPTGRMFVQAASGRIPAYVDTGLNLVHVDDVAIGHLLAFEKGKVGERYVLGERNMTLREILEVITGIAGRPPPRIRLGHNVVMPIAYAAEAWSRLTGGGEPLITVDGVRLARKCMYFSWEKARHELGFNPRPAYEALRDAVDWFRRHGYCH
jgi:dihydroflavonol-4-reductase